MQPRSESSVTAISYPFQPSSDLQAGCNISKLLFSCSPCRFQPSSDLQAGCNHPECLGVLMPRDSFNPHPTFRPDATYGSCASALSLASFNPHPTFRPDATGRDFFDLETGEVSTLIRPSGRMQLEAIVVHAAKLSLVSTLIRPSGRMQLFPTWNLQRLICCFNPHPTFRPDATSGGKRSSTLVTGFNPHPTFRPDATSQ